MKKEIVETKKCKHCLRRAALEKCRCPHCRKTDFIFDGGVIECKKKSYHLYRWLKSYLRYLYINGKESVIQLPVEYIQQTSY